MANIIGETGVAILNPLRDLWRVILTGLPNLLGAIIVLIIGVIIAVVLGKAVRIILEKIGVDEWIRKAKLTKAIGHTHVPAVIGEIFKWWLIVLFLAQAVQLVNLGVLSQSLLTFTAWLPKLIGAIVILLIGLAAVHYLYVFIAEHSRMKGMRIANKILSAVLIVILAIWTLRIINVPIEPVGDIVKYLVGAFAIAFALAFGISLGLGLKKDAESFIRELKKTH